MANLFIFVASVAAVVGAEKQYFILRHEELSSLSIDVQNGESPAVGKALAVRRRVSGLPWYEDPTTGSIRTAEGDLCVQADQEQVLRLGDCGSSDWRFYADSKEYVSGLVQGAVDSSSMKIAVWQSSKDIYKPRANVKLLSRAFAAFKNDYGAAWIKKPTNARSVNLRRLRALIDRNYLRSGNHNQCHTTCTNLRNKRIHQITTFLY